MRHEKIIAANQVRLQPRIFICTCCDVHEHRLTADAPDGWQIEYIDGTGYPFCTDCKIDLPGGHLSASGLATGAGVVSQLDEAELFGGDDEAHAHVRRLAGLARAERIGAAALPILIATIVIMSGISVLVHGTKWITM
jgi:hypothetical protein